MSNLPMKNNRMSKEQRDVLLQYMKTNPELLTNKGRFSSSLSNNDVDKLWLKVQSILNKLGVKKPVEEWKKRMYELEKKFPAIKMQKARLATDTGDGYGSSDDDDDTFRNTTRTPSENNYAELCSFDREPTTTQVAQCKMMKKKQMPDENPRKRKLVENKEGFHNNHGLNEERRKQQKLPTPENIFESMRVCVAIIEAQTLELRETIEAQAALVAKNRRRSSPPMYNIEEERNM